MKIREWIILIFTFGVGIFSVVYIYFVGFVPEYIDRPDFEEIDESDFDLIIVGETYGACAVEGCETFRILGDSSYAYVSRNTGDPTRSDGQITQEFLERLKRQVATNDLEALENSGTQTECESFAGGLDFRYKVTKGGVTHALDTCSTGLTRDSELNSAFLDIWGVVREEESQKELGIWGRFFRGGLPDALFPETL